MKALESDDPEKYMNSMKIYTRKIDPLGNKIKTHTTKTGRTTIKFLKYKSKNCL